MNNYPACTVIVLAQQVSNSAENLNKSVRLLRTRMRLCTECEHPCQAIRDLSRTIDQAILQIVDELQLSV